MTLTVGGAGGEEHESPTLMVDLLIKVRHRAQSQLAGKGNLCASSQ